MPTNVALSGCLFLVAGLTPACGGATARSEKKQNRNDPRYHSERAAARRAALRLSHKQVRKRLGGHRFVARHGVRVTVDGKADRAFTDTYELRCARQRKCYGRHDNSLEYGVEFYRLGEETYFRHRYQQFLRFQEEPAEAERRIEHIWSTGAAVVDLVHRQLRIVPIGSVSVAGRKAVRYLLQREKNAASVREKGHRAWRARLRVTHLSGEVLLGAKGVPLRLQLRYAVKAPKKGRTVAIAGTYLGEITAVGKDPQLKPPANFVQAQPRDRETLDVRRLLSGHRLNPGWFRAGGPRAARRRRLGLPEPHSMTRPAAMTRPAGMRQPAAMARPAAMAQPAAMARPAAPGAKP